jgi:hypothetical protein
MKIRRLAAGLFWFCRKTKGNMAKFVVSRIDRQSYRVLIYGHPKWADYHVIASIGVKIEVGDTVEYNPYGYNFGLFVLVLPENKW